MKALLWLLVTQAAIAAPNDVKVSFRSSLHKILVIHADQEGCEAEADGQNYNLMCGAAKTGMPIELVKKFRYPKTILSDIKNAGLNEKEIRASNPSKDFISTLKHKWGKEYHWSAGGWAYSYLCPSKSPSCVKVKFSGTMTFDFE